MSENKSRPTRSSLQRARMQLLPKAYTLGLTGFLALGLISCQPYEDTAGDMNVVLSATEVMLLDAPATSCKARANATVDDISPLHMNIGKPTISWNPPDSTTKLEIIYIRITFSSGGMADTEKPITIASEDLKCAMTGGIDGASEIPAGSTSLSFVSDIKIGGLKGQDGTNRQSFSGSANVLVYGVSTDANGVQIAPVIGRSTFRFNFQGIQ